MKKDILCIGIRHGKERSGRKGGIQQMKTIGFIDYYVSEWHANHYPIWIRELAEKTGREYTVKYAWAEMDVSPVDGRSTEDWCRDFGVENCESLKELCEKSDAIVILAPTNPETHLGYAEVALRYGKPTYIDKTFAPDFGTAKEILALAKKYRTPVFSSSALRYATELAQIPQNVEKLTITAGGSNLAEYLVHPLEMAVKLMGVGSEWVHVDLEQNGARISIGYGEKREVRIHYAPDNGYSIAVERKGAVPQVTAVKSAFFNGLMEDMLRFFDEQSPSFSYEETLEVMRLRDAILAAAERKMRAVKPE